MTCLGGQIHCVKRALANGCRFRFSSPLEEFYEHLKAGHYRPDIARMKMLIRRAERNEAKLRHKLQRQRLVGDIRQSRYRLHSLVKSLPPGIEVKMDRVMMDTSDYHNPVPLRAKQRYSSAFYSATCDSIFQIGISKSWQQ